MSDELHLDGGLDAWVRGSAGREPDGERLRLLSPLSW